MRRQYEERSARGQRVFEHRKVFVRLPLFATGGGKVRHRARHRPYRRILHTVSMSCRTGVVDADFVIFWDKDVHAARRLERAGMKGVQFRADDRDLRQQDLGPRCASTAKGGNADHRPLLQRRSTRSAIRIGASSSARRRLSVCLWSSKRRAVRSGWEVWLARSLEEANAVIDKIGAREFLMQKFVAESAGRDVRVNIVGGKVVSAMYRYNDRDFSLKHHPRRQDEAV